MALYTGRTEKGKRRTKNNRRDNDRKSDARQFKQCSHCTGKGHISADCWIAHTEKKPEAQNKKEESSFSLYSTTTLAHYRDNWLVETGASEHMCHNQEAFSTLKKSLSLKLIETASGTIKPQGIGRVKLTVRKTTGESATLELKECPLHSRSTSKSILRQYHHSI